MKKSSNKKNLSCLLKNSIRAKLICIVIIIMMFIIGAFIFANKFYLPKYYQNSKVNLLSKTYERVNSIINGDKNINGNSADNESDSFPELTDESDLKLEILEANNSAAIYVFGLSKFFNTIIYDFEYGDEMSRSSVEEKTREYVYSLFSKNYRPSENTHQLLRSTKKYKVYKVYDERIGSNYLEIFGKLDSGMYVFMRSNYQSMAENVIILNRFLSIIGCIILILALIAMIFVSARFTKPIRQLTDIAKKMADLDFEARYEVKSTDEIGMLGTSINTLSETLEKTISELKTANNELRRDVEEKNHIDEMRQEFLSNVSHELKTPIALIQGYAEGLADNINDDEESRKFYCDVIVDEASKMNKMVKKLLTLNQIESGNDQVDINRFDLTQVVNSVVSSQTLMAEKKNAVINVQRTGPLYVWADEYMVEEVITNYISNAINHVEAPGKIDVTYEKKGDILRVNVHNTGKQIPDEDLDRIWDKFFKVDKARTRAYGGSGIGLSIVKAIMDSMNRECGVSNTADGVNFWFELDMKS